jgi:hypothetical protein
MQMRLLNGTIFSTAFRYKTACFLPTRTPWRRVESLSVKPNCSTHAPQNIFKGSSGTPSNLVDLRNDLSGGAPVARLPDTTRRH